MRRRGAYRKFVCTLFTGFVFVIFVSPPGSAQPSGLVAAYSFSEGSGTTVSDSSGNNHTGTISGALWTSQGKYGNALSFDGVNDWVTVNDTPALDLVSGMTLEAWIRPTALKGWRTVILKEQYNSLAYASYANTSANQPSGEVAAPTSKDVRGPTQLPLNTWTHFAVTYDQTALRIYVNGAQVAGKAVTGDIVSSAGPIRIGGNQVWGEFFSGLIDEVRIYNRALSASEIQADMNAAGP